MNRPSRLRAVIVAVAAVLTLFAWGLASAPGSSPDDDFHLSSIWCARGLSPDRCEAVRDDPAVRLVPVQVAGVACYAFVNATSAACQNAFRDDVVPNTPSSKGNWNHLYPPVFYAVMSPLVTHDLETSVLLMRALNSLVTVAMVGSLMLLLPRRHRVLAALPLVLTSVPLGLSLFASTNPSSWAVVSAATLWPALYASFETTGRRFWALQVFAVVAAVLGAGSRGDACLFTVMAVGLVLLLRLPELRRRPLVLVTMAVCVLVSAFFFLHAGQSSTVTDGLGAQPAGIPWKQLTVTNAQALPVIWFGSLGYGLMGGTGWLDTTFPAVVGFATVAVWGGVLFASLGRVSLRKGTALGLVVGALVVYPLYVLGRSGLTVGAGFQPRYVLPLLVILTGIGLLGVRGWDLRLGTVQSVVVVVLLATAHVVALYTQIRRYVTGLDVSGLDLDAHREWWWGGPVSATAVWVVGSVAFAVLVAGIVWDRRRDVAAQAQDALA